MKPIRVVSRIAFWLVVHVAGGASAAMPSDHTEAEIAARVAAIVEQMTIEEKIDLLGGVDFFYVRGVPRLGVPRLRMVDGPMGVRNDGASTAYPGGITLAATWNQALVQLVGEQMGRDARARGAHFLLAPGVNIYRSPLTARNFEYFGEDPFLAARTAVAFIEGVQSQGVCATIKHFVANTSEYDRNNTDSVVDERALREIYLPAFEAAVKEANVGAIMTAYNLTNGVYMSANDFLNNSVAKGEWGFGGVIMSDWISTYDAIAAANGGLDLEMPSGSQLNRSKLLPAIEAGKVKTATLDDKVRRLIRTAVRFGWLRPRNLDPGLSRYNRLGRQVALEAAREGIVLLKNHGPVLPLEQDAVRSVLVVGPTAHPAVTGGGGSSRVQPFSAVSILEGLANLAGDNTQVLYAQGLPTLDEMVAATAFTTRASGGEPGLRAEYFANEDLAGEPVLERVEPRLAIGTSALPSFPDGTMSERWSGYFQAPHNGSYDVFVDARGDGGGYCRVLLNDDLVIDNWQLAKAAVSYVTLPLRKGSNKVVVEHHGRQKWPEPRLVLGISPHGGRVSAEAKALADAVDVVVVAAGFDPQTELESSDRTFRLPPGQDELIATLAKRNERTVLVTTGGGGFDMSAWLEDVPALLHAWYPGQEGGTAVAEILMGRTNPSGRLPATFERRLQDNPAYHHHYPEPNTRRVVHAEGVFVGYRGYEKNEIKPLFPFGHGLSYTTFAYSDLSLSPSTTADGQVEVSFEVTNTGSRTGSEVAQIYVGETRPAVERPAKELKGFAKVHLEARQSKRVSVALNKRSFSYYDVRSKRWRANPGAYEVFVGTSSASISLRGRVAITE